MVTNVTSFSRSGLSDFVLQRVSAVLLALYTLVVGGFFVLNQPMTHERLVTFFTHPVMLGFSTLIVFATAAHAWIGMWTIGTDYIRQHYFGALATAVRILYELSCILIIFVYVVWALQIFWRY